MRRFWGPTLPVRYRSDVHQLYAEMQTGLVPLRLLKLHGDFTKKGSAEFVAGHSDYRSLMVRDTGINQLLRHLGTAYSFLFFGYSLSDSDLLASLDSIVELFGDHVCLPPCGEGGFAPLKAYV